MGIAAAALLLTSSPATAASNPGGLRPAAAAPTETWVDSWGSSFLSTTVNGVVKAVPTFNNQTYRLNLLTQLGGTQVRVKLTNKFATNSLAVGAAHVALRSSNNSIQTSSDR